MHIAARKPDDEAERLQALRDYHVLDTAPEAAFDDITTIAAHICEVPIALVSLVDESRQWFKSKVGLAADETPRDVAFCAHAILDTGLFQVPDASQDARFKGNPLVLGEPRVQFYAGTPLVTKHGYALGTLCVIDHERKRLTPAQADMLTALGRQVIAQLELRQAVYQLQQSNHDLEQFAYVASHDLQEPLRTISSYVELLRRRYDGQLDAKAHEMINGAVNGAKRMQVLIADLLQFAELGAASTVREHIEFGGVVREITADLAERIKAIGATIVADEVATMKTDKSQLKMLLSNLIGNALKYRDPKREPEVRITVAERTSDWLVRVSDNGIGIDPANKDRIFELFKRLHVRSEYPGTGVGLAVCQRIVQRAGGRIWVESELGAGANFCFTLPR